MSSFRTKVPLLLKANHYKSCCKSKPHRQHNSNKKTFRQSVHAVTVDQPTCDDDTFYVDGVEVHDSVDSVISHSDDEKDVGFVTIHINGKPTEMKVDTGAKCNVIPQEIFQHVSNSEHIVEQKRVANLIAYGGTKIGTTGKVTLP